MVKFGVDSFARRALFSLAHASPEGRNAAFAIMTKPFKKELAKELPTKPSQFVWTCVRKTWDRLGWGGGV